MRKFLDIGRNLGFDTRIELLPIMPFRLTDIAWDRSAEYRGAVLGPIDDTVACRPRNEKPMYEVTDRFSTSDAGYRGENYCHV